MYSLLFISFFSLIFSFHMILIQAKCPPKAPTPICDATTAKYRTFDGTCNNPTRPESGMHNKCVARLLPPDYGADPTGQTTIRAAKNGKELPNERKISNAYMKDQNINNPIHTLMLMQFGQFITEDMTHVVEPRRYAYGYQIGQDDFPCCALTKPDPRFCSPIYIDPNDEFYSQFNVSCFNNFRSIACSQCDGSVRQQINQRTSFTDLGGIYIESAELNLKLRERKGGLLKTSKDVSGKTCLLQRYYNSPEPRFPPDTAESCEPKYDGVCFSSGDSPANQQPGLTTLHTFFHRQHNRIARMLSKINPHYSDETIFQETRRILVAQFQHIIYNEYLPRIVGPEKLIKHRLTVSEDDTFTSFDPSVDPTLLLEWSTAAFRFGHSTVQNQFLLMQPDGRTSFTELREQYFHPERLYFGDFPAFLRGLTASPMGGADPFFVDAVRNHVLQPFDKQHGFDLPALNIRRGREHGIKGYIHYIKHCDGRTINSFSDLYLYSYIPQERVEKLSMIYANVQDIDLFVGGLSEFPVANGVVGPTFACIIATQFERIKYGDRFYYEHDGHSGAFTSGQLNEIKKTTLAGLICSNGVGVPNMQLNAFDLIEPQNPRIPCEYHYDIIENLAGQWKDEMTQNLQQKLFYNHV